jgi:hypothetical protein
LLKITPVDPNEKSGISPILAILTFNCNGSKTLAAQVLHLAGVEQYVTVPSNIQKNDQLLPKTPKPR